MTDMKMMWLCAQKLVLTKEASEKTILYIGGSDILPEPADVYAGGRRKGKRKTAFD